MRFGGGSERDTHYKKSGRPHHSVYSRTIRGILADRPPLNFYIANRLKLPLVNSAQYRRTVRGKKFAVKNFSAEPLVNKSHERRTVRLLPADRLQYQISDSPEFCQLSQFQLQFGIIAHIKFLKSQNLHEHHPKAHMSKFQQEIQNKSS